MSHVRDLLPELPATRRGAPVRGSETAARIEGSRRHPLPRLLVQIFRGAFLAPSPSSKEFPKSTIIPNGDGYTDLLLAGEGGVTHERALVRRKEIDEAYKYLSKSDLVIITLGLAEAWYDEETRLFINRRLHTPSASNTRTDLR
jgi:hypothetical protein